MQANANYDRILEFLLENLNDIQHTNKVSKELTLNGEVPLIDVYTFAVPSSSEWRFHQVGLSFELNVFVDIAATTERKVQGLQCYTTEVRPFPHPRSPEAIRAIAQRWGSAVGVEYSEAFELVWSVR